MFNKASNIYIYLSLKSSAGRFYTQSFQACAGFVRINIFAVVVCFWRLNFFNTLFSNFLEKVWQKLLDLMGLTVVFVYKCHRFFDCFYARFLHSLTS
jgi:hypothetical protein